MAINSFPWNQVNTLVQDYIVPTLREQIFVGSVFFDRCRGRVKRFSGGRQIVQPLIWKQEGGGGGWFSGNDPLDTTLRDPIQAMSIVPKNAYVPISISWEDQMTVRGPEQIKPLLETKSEIARMTIKDLINTALYNDGSQANQITGIGYSLKDYDGTAPGQLGNGAAQTYGGITRRGRPNGTGTGATNTWFVHWGDNSTYVTSAAGNFDPLTAGRVHQVLGSMYGKIWMSSMKEPTLGLSNVGTWTTFHNALSLGDRYERAQTNVELAKSGYRNLMYRNMAWVVDPRAPRSSAAIEKLYMLNEDTVRLYVHDEADMHFEPFRKPVNQMTQTAYILWRGELIVIEPRANGVISNIDTTTVMP